jgi:4-hydroxybenzoate polyprenyltransferase
MKSQVVGLAKASHFGPTLLVTTISYIFGEIYWSTGSALLIALAIFSGQLVVGWSNDLIDYKDDLSHQRRNKPLVGELISRTLLQRCLALVLPTALLLNLFGPLGLVAGSLSLFTIGWAVAYNFYFKFNIFSPLPYAVAFALLPSLIAISADYTPPTWMWVCGALFGTAAHFLNVIKDMEQDRLSGIKGLPQRLGSKASALTAIALIAIAIAVLLASDLTLP